MKKNVLRTIVIALIAGIIGFLASRFFVAVAEEIATLNPEISPVGEIEKTGFDWGFLATISGCTAATVLISQFVKFPLDKCWKIPTKCLVYFIALAISVIAGYFTNHCMNLEGVVLSILNSFIVAAAAYGTYELSFKKIEKKG